MASTVTNLLFMMLRKVALLNRTLVQDMDKDLELVDVQMELVTIGKVSQILFQQVRGIIYMLQLKKIRGHILLCGYLKNKVL